MARALRLAERGIYIRLAQLAPVGQAGKDILQFVRQVLKHELVPDN